MSYCSTWASLQTNVTPPTERGGTIADGIYRLERGTFSVDLMQFEGNRVNLISASFYNNSGTYTTSNGMMSFTFDKRCDRDGTEDSPSMSSGVPYLANGDTLLIGRAMSGDAIVWYEYKRIAVDQICTADANVKCNVSNCSCAVVTNGFGTVTSGLKSCSSQ